MKYEYLKGSEKDFEGCDDNSLVIYKSTGMGLPLAIIAERRPITEQVWDGEGLMPSVGMKCLAKQCSQINADEFLVVAIQDGAVFGFWTSTGAATGLDVNRWVFLPIRSPEDVARDEAIGAMERAWEDETLIPAVQFEVIYDAIAAGKIKGVVLESNTSDLKINVTTDEMWREFEKNSDMQDVYNLFRERASLLVSF